MRGEIDEMYERAWYWLTDRVKTRGHARRAYFWFRRCAEQGHVPSQGQVGDMLLSGEGVRKDVKEAVRWLRLAAAAGDTDALTTLGVCYFYGTGVRRNKRAAFEHYLKAAATRNGSGAACWNLALCFVNGDGTDRDYVAAMQWFKKTANSDSCRTKESAMLWLSRLYAEGLGVRRSPRWARHWRSRAVAHRRMLEGFREK